MVEGQVEQTTHGRGPGETEYTWWRARWNRLHIDGQVEQTTHDRGLDGTDYTW